MANKMIPRQVNAKELRAIHKILRSHWGSITELAGQLGIGQPAISLWLKRGFGLSADKEICIRKRAAELEKAPAKNGEQKEYRRRNPEKQSAWDLVKSAIREGKLLKPNTCQSCGTPTRGKELNAHHEDYSKPLDVQWLCLRCHSLLHIKRDKQPKAQRASILAKQSRASEQAFREYLKSRKPIKSSLAEKQQDAMDVSLNQLAHDE